MGAPLSGEDRGESGDNTVRTNLIELGKEKKGTHTHTDPNPHTHPHTPTQTNKHTQTQTQTHTHTHTHTHKQPLLRRAIPLRGKGAGKNKPAFLVLGPHWLRPRGGLRAWRFIQLRVIQGCVRYPFIPRPVHSVFDSRR